MIGRMEIAFLGFGLIAGSIARAVRTRGTIEERRGDRLVAWSPTGAGARAAREDGVIDTVVGSPGEAAAWADLVIIAAPPLEAIALLGILADPTAARLRPSTVVTDVTSTMPASSSGQRPLASRSSEATRWRA